MARRAPPRPVDRSHIFSSESVTEGHPDKLADRISDSILDAYLKEDPFARVACETLVATEFIVLAGEISAKRGVEVDHEKVARQAVKAIGYDSAETGIGWKSAQFNSRIVAQSPDIAQGVSRARTSKRIGAGDQGLMFGYAEAPRDDGRPAGADYMPLPISLAHSLTRGLAELRRSTLRYLRPDGKSQVSVRYEDGKPIAVDAVVVAAQHNAEMSRDQAKLHEDLREHLIGRLIPADLLHKGTKYFLNHTGKFEKGGPASDTGLTGRKIIVDTYGGWVPHGGGAFSGKDATKVDRSGAYAARHAAKNLVADGVAERLQIQVAYSIGEPEPVSIGIETFGTAHVPDEAIERRLRREFDFTPGGIIDALDLRKPIFTQASAYGHFGRTDLDLPWERLR